MRKAPLWLFIIVLALTGVVLWQRHETDQATTTKPGSTIDQLLQNNTT